MNQPHHASPPRWAAKLLKWLLPPHLSEELEGDLHEQFLLQAEALGERKARQLYVIEVLKFCRPYFLRRRKRVFASPHSPYIHPIYLDMLRNYFKIALRNLSRQRAFSFLNISGLAVGMAASILILLWVKDEWSYDRFHAHAGQLYRLTSSTPDLKAAVTPAPVAAAMQAGMPEVRKTVRLLSTDPLLGVGSRKFTEKRVFYADSTFLEVFSFPLLAGDARTALQRPDGILLTEEMARKYFGTAQALGKTIRKDNRDYFTVTGVLANVPGNSHLQFDFILPMSFIAATNEDLKGNRWGSFNFYTYVQLDENAAGPAALQKLGQRITRLYREHVPAFPVNFQLQPITSIHLHSSLLRDVPGNGNVQYVHILGVVAVFILVVACINFMNLATARSARRAREVGLRKVVGARRHQLIWQFLSESCLISFLALVVAVVIVLILLPVFNDLSGKKLSVDVRDDTLLLGLPAVALLTGLLSGSYPALFLSGFQPVHVLKGTLRLGNGGVLFRNALVVCQFVVSIILLVGTTVVYQQLDFIRNRNLGFDKANLLYVPVTGELWGKTQALEAALQQNLLTSAYTITQDLPTNLGTGHGSVQWEGKDPNSQPVIPTMGIDERFTQVFNVQLLSGRSFSKAFRADTANYLVNEKALQLMGMELATAVGKPLTLEGVQGTIVGVVKDFHFKPVQQAIEPLILHHRQWGVYVVVRTQPGQTEATIGALEKICRELNPAYPFAYNFLDQDLDNLYQSEKRISRLFNVFAALAVFISCLGLYGLSAFVAEQRTKEMGVRRVLGASLLQVLYLLSSTFARLLGIATVIALPLAWLAGNSWLQGFVYRINLGWPIFLGAILIALLTAALSVSYESVKAALANPARSLRNE